MLKYITSMCILFSISSFADDFIIATGGEGGGYERAGKEIGFEIKRLALKKDIDFDFEVLNTAGSVENISLFNEGEAQLVIAQADALNINPISGGKAKGLYTETVFWMYNLKNKYDDLEDIEKKKDVLMVLVDGSGGAVTMQYFAQEDTGYKVNYDTAILADDNYEAADLVCEGKIKGKKIAGMLYVGKTIPAEIREDFRQCIGVGEATDSDFNDAEDINGEQLYKSCEINKGLLGGLTSSARISDLDTVCVEAMAVYSTNLEEKGLSKLVSKAINKAKRRL